MAQPDQFRVFLSAVSSEFAEARRLVASDLRSKGIVVKVQDDFRSEIDSVTTLDLLHDYIKDCEAVVCAIGERSGSLPTEVEAMPYAAILPDGVEEASYAQWEFFLAQHYSKRLSLYRATELYVPDKDEPTGEDHPDLQSRFVERLFDELGRFRGEFSNADELGRLVLREDWPQRAPGKPVALPYLSLGEGFHGRESLLDQVHDSLTTAERATAIAGRVLHGLGGVGKTRLAVEYAWRHVDDYSALLFVPAETPAVLSQNLAGLCAVDALDLPEREAAAEDAQVAAVLRWLAGHAGWLVIFDNLDTPEAARAARDLLPKLRGGTVLMTGRLSDWGAGIHAIELDVLAEADAATFLLDRTEHRRRHLDSDTEDALELAQELGCLALALEQAGAYIAQHRQSLVQYLAEWRSQEARVREWHDPTVTDYPHSVAVTWQTTIEQLDSGERALLRLLAWLAPEPIPTFVFESEGAEAALRSAVVLLEPGGVAEPGTVSQALARLARFSMVRWDADTQTVAVHRVVQGIVRDRISPEEADAWVEGTIELLVAAHSGDPTDVRTWGQWDALRPHIAAALRSVDDASASLRAASLMREFGKLLQTKALYDDALSLFRRALATVEDAFRVEDLEEEQVRENLENPLVAYFLSSLAQLLHHTNRLDEAEPLLRRALAIHEASLGSDSFVVAGPLSDLAELLIATNRLDEAEPLLRRALAIDEASSGVDHQSVVAHLSRLARLLQITNRLDEAEELLRRALAISETSVGPDHPWVATHLNNLAQQLLQNSQRLDEAEPLLRRALAIDEASLGPDHPGVAVDLSNLGGMLRVTNRLHEAEPLLRRALAIDEASFGSDHPRVATHLNGLALLLQASGRLDEAEPLLRRALAIDEASLGPDHPDVARDLNNLALLFGATGRLDEAEPLARRTVEIFIAFSRRTGHEHLHLRSSIGTYYGLLEAMSIGEDDIRAIVSRLFSAYDYNVSFQSDADSPKNGAD